MKTTPETTTSTETYLKGLQRILAGLMFVLLMTVTATAQTYTVMHSFGTNVMGLYPYASLVQGPDGLLYGTTLEGGTFDNLGQVFKVNPDGSGYTVLKDFHGEDGANPQAGLVLSGTTLYGTTREGGSNWYGTVFKLQTDGSGFQVLKEFTGDDGAELYASLVLSGSTLYGTTAEGGINGVGTVFKLQTDGSGYEILKAFSRAEGAYIQAGLVLSGTTLFGTTTEGGSNNCGTVYRINTDGSDYRMLHSFTEPIYSSGEGTNSDGAWPAAGVTISGTTLFGTTPVGGVNGHGIVFKLNTDGSGFVVLKDFTGSDGRTSCGDLLLSGTTLYGTTAEGGSSAMIGNVFKLNTDGSGFMVLKELSGDDGVGPCSGLVLSNTTLYGTASSGGNNGYGTIFKLETDGSDYTVITHFAGGDGGNPNGNLLLSGTTLYGATASGGASGNGTLFKIDADGSGYSLLKDFTNGIDGASPNGNLVLSGMTLYGTTIFGGTNGSGTIYKVNTNGSDFTLLYQFSPLGWNGSDNTNRDGALPQAGLVVEGNTIYGTTAYGGNNANGTVFKLNIDGSEYEVLHTFAESSWSGSTWTNIDGSRPYAGLVLSGSTLYGTTPGGGSKGYGTAFSLEADGSGYSVLREFGNDTNGAGPNGVILSGATLYGTTFQGGGSRLGTVFKLNTDGTGFTVLMDFTPSDGAYPHASLVLSGTTLYGTTDSGGISDNGTVFQVNNDGGGFAVLKHFTGSDGASPRGGLAFSGATLFGTTVSGGGMSSGVLYSLAPGVPIIVVQPPSQTVAAGSAVVFHVEATGWPSPAYQWLKDGAELNDGGNISGTRTATLALTNILGGDAGGYSVVVSNTHGSVTSSVAILTVVGDPFIITQPARLTIVPWQTAQFSVVVGGTPPVSCQWRKNSSVLAGQTSALLTLANAQLGDAGSYDVIVSNSYGSLTSAVAVLTVNLPVTSSTLHHFTDSSMGLPFAGLVASGTMLYGPTVYGKIYRINTASNSFTFVGQVSGDVRADLLLSGSTLYGTTSSGGSYGLGSIFRINTDGSGYTVLKHFTGVDGAKPESRLVSSGTTLYGATLQGGGSNCGTIFRIQTDGSGYAVIKEFIESDGKEPKGDLLLSGTTLFGTTISGGPQGNGTVFRTSIDGSGFTVLHNFATTWPDGSYPYGGLILSGTSLYGTTTQGGVFGGGTVFKIETNGSGFQVLKSFRGADGREPQSGLLLSGSTLHGTTFGVYQGGVSNLGTVFMINTDGSGFRVLKHFVGSDGANPRSGLVMLGHSLYGTAGYGGANNSGVVFELSFTEPPSLVFAPQSQTAEAGSAVRIIARSDGQPPLGYQWFFDGTNALDGCTNAVLSLVDLQFAHSGTYTIVITNAAGAITSSPAMLVVIPPVARRMVPGVSLSSAGGSIFQLDYTDALSASPIWVPLATISIEDPPQRYFDVTEPLPTQRFYRASQVGGPGVMLSLNLQMVPALTLSGIPGNSVKVDGINAIGPIDAWFTLDTVMLTNASQYYFDVSALGQPPRLYRLTPLP